MQLCKHLTNNPRPESAVRAWQLMCMSVGTFPPSRDFENHLINFILQHKDGAGAVGNYARYSLRRLEGILNSGPSGFVPSVEEIQAYKERPPILATIELVDGTPLTEDLPITPDLNVAKVLDICYHFLECVLLRAPLLHGARRRRRRRRRHPPLRPIPPYPLAAGCPTRACSTLASLSRTWRTRARRRWTRRRTTRRRTRG